MTQYFSLRKKLLTGVLLVSTLATAVIVGLTFLYDYQQEMQALDEGLISLETSAFPPMAKAIWDFSHIQIENQIQGLVNLPWVIEAKLTYADGERQLHIKDQNIKSSRTREERTYDLRLNSEITSPPIGRLTLVICKDEIFKKLMKKAMVFFVLQGFKTLAISLLLLLLFQHFVTRHIEKIAEHLKRSEKENFDPVRTLKLSSNYWLKQRDEFQTLESAINEMSLSTHLYNKRIQEALSASEKQLQDQTAKALYSSKMATLGEMAAGISHEINNPLSVIMMKLELMKRPNYNSEKSLKGDLDSLDKVSHRIKAIVSGLRKFSRDGSKDEMTLTSIQQIFDDAVLLCSEKLKSSDVRFELQVVESQLLCRAIEISQVIINLISNSADAVANQSNKWIRVAGNVTGQNYQITITDSGEKIPSEIQDKIMQPFFTTKPVGQGTGLGLSVSKGIIEDHEGRLEFLSNEPHTTFQITLPLPLHSTAIKSSQQEHG